MSKYGGASNAFQQILTDWNQASKIFENTFNVVLGLIKIQLYDTCDTSATKDWNRVCTDDYDINRRLNDFSKWRGTHANDGAGLWHLVGSVEGFGGMGNKSMI